MRRILFFIFFPLCFSLPVYSQIFVEGKILNLSNEEPVAYVNIGIVNTSIGTLSNEDGSFSVKIPRDYSSKSVVFSALGFGLLKVPVSELSGDNFYTIYLRESPTQLKPVLVEGEIWKGKNYRLGNSRFEGSCIYADTVMAGSAMALKINCDELLKRKELDYPVFIKEAQVIIVNNTFGEFKIRTRLNEIDPVTGHPGKDILNTSILTQSSVKNGKLTVDLTKYNIKVNKNFFLAFEWIFDKEDRNFLYQEYERYRRSHPEKVTTDYINLGNEKIPFINYGGNLYAGPSFGVSLSNKSIENNVCYYRLNSLGNWTRSFLILAANITLSDHPEGVLSDPDPKLIAFDDPSPGMMPYFKITPKIPGIDEFEQAVNFINDTTYFSTRMVEPISIQVRRIENHIRFYAYNHSFYPYFLELSFSNIRNLQPVIKSKSFILKPREDAQHLINFDVTEPSIPEFHYDLELAEDIGDTSLITKDAFPYLFPVGSNREVGLISDIAKTNHLNRDIFKMFIGDTIYAMRKGMVVATPKMEFEADRISNDGTLEIMHSDGTVMVYYHINSDDIFIQPGEMVFPGQPLGLINDNYLEIELFEIIGRGKLKRLEINYLTKKGICRYYEIPVNELSVYPDTMISKEMTSAEKRRYK